LLTCSKFIFVGLLRRAASIGAAELHYGTIPIEFWPDLLAMKALA
jgi:hypothetical protein